MRTAIVIACAVAWLGSGLVPNAAARRITTVLDAPGDGVTPYLGNPLIRIDAAGNRYVLSNVNDVVFKVTPAGAVSVIIDASGDGLGHPLICSSYVCDLLVTDAGDVYVTGAQSDNVFHIDPAGVVTQVLDASGDGMGNPLDRPAELAMDAAGNLFVVGFYSFNVLKITPGGGVSTAIDATGDGLGNGLTFPWGIAVDGAGTAFVVGTGSQNVFAIDAGGAITEIIDASGDGLGHAFSPVYTQPVLDTGGNVYVVSRYTNAVFKISPSQVVTAVIDATGDGGAHPLSEPHAVALDAQGNAYVSGVFTNLFRVQPGGAVDFVEAFSADVVSVFADPLGAVYVSTSYDVFRAVGDRLQLVLDARGDGTQEETYWGGITFGPGALYVATLINPQRIMRVESLCDPAPRASCRMPTSAGASKLVVKDYVDDGRDLVSWRWLRGQATDLSDFGDPTTLDYGLCLYAPGSDFPVFEASAPAGATCDALPCWTAKGSSGFQYRDRDLRAPDGVFKIVMKAGPDEQAKIVMKANRENVVDDLSLPLLPGAFPLVVQLQASNGECWEATYSSSGVTTNTENKLVGLSD